MKRLIATCLAMLVLAGPAPASDAARQVISDQIAAFRQDDFVTAFGFASPAIRGIFGTPERFGQMVREGYPMVWRPAEVTFLEAEDFGQGLRQGVLIRDLAGDLFELEYEMIRDGDGWKINGVRVRPAPPGLV